MSGKKTIQPPNDKIFWLPQEQYDKAVLQLRLQVGGIMHPLRMYGQDPFVDQAIDEIVRLTEDFGLRVRGVDKPISLEMVRRKSNENN